MHLFGYPVTLGRMPLRFAIMGTGKIAGKVTPYIQRAEGCRVVAAASRDANRARAFASELGIGETADAGCTYDELLARDDIDAVYITLPNGDHPVWSERLLEAGKHVLCEKPLCWTRAQAERLFEVAGANRRVLAEAFMYLHSPLTADAIALARTAMHDPDASPIGRLTKIVARFDISIEDGWKDTPKSNIRYSRALVGGALMDLGCYPVSFARTVTGETPASLDASATMVDRFEGSPRDGSDAVDGAASLTGAFPSGVAFDLSCSMIEPMKDNGGRAPDVLARLIGDKGAAEIRDFPRPERILLMGERIEGGEKWIDSPLADPAEVYRLQAESFARAAAEGGAAKPSGEWSIEQAGVLERALEAIGLRFDEPGW